MSSSPGPAPARGPMAGGRVGLSEYTAQRLAELRARRAEAESTDYVKPSTAPRPTVSRAGDGTAADSATRSTSSAAVSRTSDMAINGVKTDTPAPSCVSHSSHKTTVTDVSPVQSQTNSVVSVNSPHLPHYQQQQQHITSRSRSPASNRHDSNCTVDRTRTHQVG